MVLRETTFAVGGFLTIALGILLGVGLFVTGAGFEFFGAWVGAALAVGLGAFFVHVGREEGRERRRSLHELESGPGEPPPNAGP
jgi:hypothetical protein